MKTLTRLLPASARAGLTGSQLERFDIGELVAAAATGDAGRLAFYRSASDRIERQTERPVSTVSSFYVPAEVLRRDLGAAVAAGGGYLTAGTDVPMFSQALTPESLLDALPLRTVPVEGNAQVPVSASTPTTTWLSTEGSQADDAALTYGASVATPKSVSAVATASRALDLSQPATARVVGADLLNAVWGAAGAALVNGSGASGQPLGLLGLSGATSVSGTSLGWSGIRDALATVEGYSASKDNIAFVLGVGSAKILRSREVATGSGLVLGADGRICGYRCVISRSMPTDALLLADWSRVTMFGWASIELTITPFASAAAFQRGAISLRAILTVDFAAERPAMIVKSTSIT